MVITIYNMITPTQPPPSRGRGLCGDRIFYHSLWSVAYLHRAVQAMLTVAILHIHHLAAVYYMQYSAYALSDSHTRTEAARTSVPFNSSEAFSNIYLAMFSEEGFCA